MQITTIRNFLHRIVKILPSKSGLKNFKSIKALKSPETNFKVEIPKVTSKDFDLNDRGRNKKNKRSFEDYHSITLSSQKNPGEIEM